MVVQHNLTAMNSNRMLGVTTSGQSKSAEKLSSGYRINRAADDAAGLTISEKMRKQIRGLSRASTNAQDGVSAVQTAEGALTEVHSMLQRMNELAVQASNGTNSEADRDAIQAEIEQLTTEIDRVSETTKFNETYLLKGNTAGTTTAKKINAHDAGIDGKLVDNGDTALFTKVLENGDKAKIAGVEYTIGNKATKDSTDGYAVYAADKIGDQTLQAGDTITYMDGDVEKTATMVEKVENADGFKNGTVFEVVDETGHKKTYTIAAASKENGDGAAEIKADEAKALIADELAKGHTVTMTKYNDGTSTTDVNWEIVGEDTLEDNEIAANVWNTAATSTVNGMLTEATGLGKTAAGIKSVTLNGETTTFTAKTPVSSKDIAEIIGKLQKGDKIKVYADSQDADPAPIEITIAEKTDVKKGEYTIEDALRAINVDADDIDGVEFSIDAQNKDALELLAKAEIENVRAADGTTTFNGSKMVSVVGSPAGDESTEGNILTVNEAYAKIAEELQKASSIGVDEGSEASVTSDGKGNFTITKGSATVQEDLSFNLHVGADADMTNKIGVNIEAMSAAGLGIKGLEVYAKDENGKTINDGGIKATYAIDAIADAISKVSAQRSALGAVQNRLDHTIANLDNVVENTTAAESRIRDTDMATEMVEYSKNNILAQAGQSMLAQANQSNQGVLSLLG